MIDETLEKKLTKELKIDMKGLGIPIGAAESFAKEIIKDVKKSVKGKKIITEQDLNRYISASAKKYNKDLAYVYQIRDKII
jgi:hypothetical protein